jgi:hypothetical protein
VAQVAAEQAAAEAAAAALLPPQPEPCTFADLRRAAEQAQQQTVMIGDVPVRRSGSGLFAHPAGTSRQHSITTHIVSKKKLRCGVRFHSAVTARAYSASRYSVVLTQHCSEMTAQFVLILIISTSTVQRRRGVAMYAVTYNYLVVFS